MPWSLAGDGFLDYTPSVVSDPSGLRTKIYYVSRNGNNATAVADDWTKPWRHLAAVRKFTVAAANATVGATYTSGGCTFVVAETISGATTLYCYRFFGQTPSGSGTLTKTGGTGDATITFSANSAENGAVTQMTIDSGGLYPVLPRTTSWVLVEMGAAYPLFSAEVALQDNWQVHGHSYLEPGLLSCYDPSIRMTTAWGEFCVPNPANSALTQPDCTPWSDSGGGGSFLHTAGSSDYSVSSSGNNCHLVGIECSGVGGPGIFFLQGVCRSFLAQDIHSHSSGFGAVAGGVGIRIHRSVFHDNAGQGFDGGGTPVTVYTPTTDAVLGDGGSYCVEMIESMVDMTGVLPGNGFLHALYINGFVDPFLGTVDAGPVRIAGNTISRDTSTTQIRCGGIVDNNSFIKCGQAMIIGNTSRFTNRQNRVTRNVICRGWQTDPENSGGIGSMGGYVYVSDQFNWGTTLVDSNIICNTLSATSNFAIYLGPQVMGWTVSNNWIYKWSQTSTAILDQSDHACTRVGTITPGSGYTDKTKTITNITFSDAGSSGPAIAYVTMNNATGWPWADDIHAREGWVYIDGINGAMGAVLNNKVHRIYYRGDLGAVLQIQGDYPDLTGTSYTGGGTVYIPYLGRMLKAQTGVGTFLRADVHVAHGGVVGITFGSDADNRSEALPSGQGGAHFAVDDEVILSGGLTYNFTGVPDFSPASAPVNGDVYSNNGHQGKVYYSEWTGSDYVIHMMEWNGAPAASGTLTRVSGSGPATMTFGARTQQTGSDGSDVAVIPGGSGFKFTVGAVAGDVVFDSNVVDEDGTGVIGTNAPDPDRTPASYYDLIMETTGSTDDDYLDARRDMRRQTWNPLLLADSYNDYQREGMGLPMEGSAYSAMVGGLTLAALDDGTVGVAYSDSATASGGTGPYTYAIIAGALPTGLSLNAGSGAVTGTPTVAGDYSFRIEATDALDATGSRLYSVTIAAGAPADYITVTLNVTPTT